MTRYKNLLQTVIITFLGTALGLIIIKGLTFPERWTIAIIVGILCIFVGMLFVGYFEKIIYACFIFFLPLQLGKSLFYVPYTGGGHEFRLNLPEIFFAILLLHWFVDLVMNKRSIKLDLWLLLSSGSFLFLSFLSLFIAINISLSAFELIRALIAFLIFLFVANYIDSEKKLKETIIIFLLGTIPQIGLGLYQWISEQDIGLQFFGEMGLRPEQWALEPIVRVGGLIGHPNAFATYLTLTLPFCIIFWAKDQNMITKIISFTLFITGTIALIATQSRGAWLGCSISFIIAFFIFITASERYRLSRWLVSIIIIISLAVLSISSHDVIKKRLFLDDYGSAASRIPMMFDAIHMIQDNPILGIGLNNYALAVPQYDITGIHREWQATTVHNIFLLIAAESGLFAMLAFILFWLFILWRARNLLKLPNTNYFLLAIAFIMSLVSFLIIHQVDPNYRFYPAIQRQIWLIAGLAVAASNIIKRDKLKLGSLYKKGMKS